jgi:hypothetical protein
LRRGRSIIGSSGGDGRPPRLTRRRVWHSRGRCSRRIKVPPSSTCSAVREFRQAVAQDAGANTLNRARAATAGEHAGAILRSCGSFGYGCHLPARLRGFPTLLSPCYASYVSQQVVSSGADAGRSYLHPYLAGAFRSQASYQYAVGRNNWASSPVAVSACRWSPCSLPMLAVSESPVVLGLDPWHSIADCNGARCHADSLNDFHS